MRLSFLLLLYHICMEENKEKDKAGLFLNNPALCIMTVRQ